MAKAKPKVKKICETCSAMFELQPSVAKYNAARFCSRECTKPMYSKLFKGNKSRVGLSSWNKGLFNIKTGKRGPRPNASGSKNHNWRGGTSNKTRSRVDISSWEYRKWRTSVFKRDNYTCQICDQYGGVLHADHIVRWADNEELRYDVSNGRALCVPCHYYITFKRKMKPGQRWCNFTARKRG